MVATVKTLNQTNMLKAVEKAYMKTKYFHDVEGRNTYMVQAPIGAKNGESALVTKYVFVVDSTLADGSIEYEGTWNEAWDIEMTDPE